MNECCKDPQNLETVEMGPIEEQPTHMVQQCQECGRKHRTMFADPGEIGAEMKGM